MPYAEHVLTLQSGDKRLPAILALPEHAARMAVLVIVGGPQYRVGSHRQFVLLSRALAEQGFACLRFDYSGMGDAEGEPVDFEHCGPDVRSAVDALMAAVPGLTDVCLWGLCDGATAAAFHAAEDERVTSLILLNPWVRTEQGQSEALVKHYYLQRILSKDFWRKLLGGGVGIGPALREFAAHLRRGMGRRGAGTGAAGAGAWRNRSLPLTTRVPAALRYCRANIMVVLAGDDLVGSEFDASFIQTGSLASLQTERLRVERVAGATHTFSSAQWRATVERLTCEWLRACVSA